MKKVKYVEPKPCGNCGGRHFGSPKDYCPYIKAACVVCGEDTIYACSDCAIDGKGSVHVCVKVACQRKHEEIHPERQLRDLRPELASPKAESRESE